MRATALVMLLLLGAASLLLSGASASSLDVATDVQGRGEAPLPATTLVPADTVPVPVVVPGSADLSLPQVQAEGPVAVAIGVQAEAGLDVVPGPAAPAILHPASDTSSPSEVALELATDAAPVAVAAVGLTAAAFALRFLLGLLPAGLFSRIDRGQLLDNPVRARVHDAVANEPGVTLSEVQQRAGIAWGTTVHHLRRLESHGLVVSVSQRAHRRYFLANTPAAAQRAALAAILHPTARRIATLVAAQPGIDQTGLCQTLGLNGPAASKHLAQFRSHGLVTSLRDGRRTRHAPTAGLHAALQLLGAPPASTILVAQHAAGTTATTPHMSVPLAGLSLASA